MYISLYETFPVLTWDYFIAHNITIPEKFEDSISYNYYEIPIMINDKNLNNGSYNYLNDIFDFNNVIQLLNKDGLHPYRQPIEYVDIQLII